MKTIKIRVQINETENRKTLEKINKIKNWFIENINKRDKYLARLSKKNRTKTQTTNIQNEWASLIMLQQ